MNIETQVAPPEAPGAQAHAHGHHDHLSRGHEHHGHHGHHRGYHHHDGEHDPSHEIAVMVNNNPVAFCGHWATGLEIKEAAIAQKVAIQLDFVLFDQTGESMKTIGDTDRLELHHGQKFQAVTPDDNS